MDAKIETSSKSEPTCVARPAIDHAEMRAILSNLSHELCRPLISLRAGFDLLLGDPECPVSAEQHRHIQTMIGLCDNLLLLTRNYLDYAGLVQRARSLHYGTFTLGALIRDVEREFASTAEERGIDWTCRLDGPDGPVSTDATRCQQILGNLVANALKYTPRGGRVKIAAHHDRSAWIVTVEDDGPGIPAESQARVFEPFFRLPREERSRIEGNGLGLAICRELVEQMGGDIDLDSGAGRGRGTRFSVRLPVERPQNSQSERGSPSPC